MIKILAFESIHLIFPLRFIYITLLKKIMNSSNSAQTLLLYRLDQDNIFLSNSQNISGQTLNKNKDDVDALSILFYKFLGKKGICKDLKFKDLKLYDLYTRQVKLKLSGVIRGAIRISNLASKNKDKFTIITDSQSASIMKQALLFLNLPSENIVWKQSILLTACITLNSMIMRAIALLRMLIKPSKLPKEYFYKIHNPNLPTLLMTSPRKRPKDFFSSYVKGFESKFNIIIYCMGFISKDPIGYKRNSVKGRLGIISGLFRKEYFFFTESSYIADILLIFKNHSDLSLSIDIVNSLYCNPIDVHISRLQTNVIDNYLAIEAKRRGIFVLGDLQEEIFYCDAAVCSSKSENTQALELATRDQNKIAYKGSNSLIKYRLESFTADNDHYLHEKLNINLKKKIIFYASDPSREECQRYQTEKLLFNFFANRREYFFIIKTHSQDNGKVTYQAFIDSGKPSNIILIGDIVQNKRIVSRSFKIFEEFNFNAAVSSSDMFLTASSSSILQALALNVKAGIVDLYQNGYYDYLISAKAVMLINNENALNSFLDREQLKITDEILNICGINNSENFDMNSFLLSSLKQFRSKF